MERKLWCIISVRKFCLWDRKKQRDRMTAVICCEWLNMSLRIGRKLCNYRSLVLGDASPNLAYVHESGRRGNSMCVQGQPSRGATPLCVQTEPRRAAVYAVYTESRGSRKQECVQEARGAMGKGNTRQRGNWQRGRRERLRTWGRMYSLAQAIKRRRRERKGTNKGNICHTENMLDEKQA